MVTIQLFHQSIVLVYYNIDLTWMRICGLSIILPLCTIYFDLRNDVEAMSFIIIIVFVYSIAFLSRHALQGARKTKLRGARQYLFYSPV